MNDIRILDFDTKLFGFRIGEFTGRRLSFEKTERIIEYCKNNEIKCLYADLDMNDFATLDTATKHGFVISDIRMVFEKDLTNSETSKKAEIDGYQIDDNIGKTDIPHLRSLSKEISQVSRFAFDRNFPEKSCERMYTTWVMNSINKEAADGVFVARELKTKHPIAIITCKKKADHGEIVLFGLKKEHFGRAIASFLLDRALSFFEENGFKKVRVRTQGGNVPAQRLYQKKGFLTYSTSIFFHVWIELGSEA